MTHDPIRSFLDRIEELRGRPAGISLVEAGKCPAGRVGPMACMLCPMGHMLDCHYPKTCSEAQCGHYEAEAPR